MTVVFEGPGVTVHHGDCIEVMRTIPDASIDAIVTDPPYGLEFMGKDWDGADGFRRSLNPNDAGRTASKATAGMSQTGYSDGANRIERPSFLGGLNPKCTTCGKWQRGGNPCSCESPTFTDERLPRLHTFQEWCTEWAREALRVLKPGGHLLAFGGSRTWHRLAAGIEDAGFEIRDSIAWLYGSGFPKSLDVSKAIDAAAGAKREVVAEGAPVKRMIPGADQNRTGSWIKDNGRTFVPTVTAPATEEAAKWEGWGTALKPAFEPIVVGRKPLVGTVAANVLTHGTGALNIDASRVGDGSDSEGDRPAREASSAARYTDRGAVNLAATPGPRGGSPAGRWPTNVVLDESQAAELDKQAGTRTSGAKRHAAGDVIQSNWRSLEGRSDAARRAKDSVWNADSGGASRFFPTFRYEAKAGSDERPNVNGVQHPTVKPLDLMRWLVRLVTPPNGVILEPFAGSGTTLEAAVLEGFQVIGIEREADYLPLIEARLTKPLQPVMFGDWGADA